MHRQAVHRGRVNYEPNSLGGGCPFQAGTSGYMSFPQPIAEDKVRGKPELFSDHYSQARLFWQSQAPIEQAHIIGAFRFELTRVQTPAVRERVLAMLANVDDALVSGVADGLGMPVPDPMPLASNLPIPEFERSPALSLLSRPGETGIRTRRVAILVAGGVDATAARTIYAALLKDGAVPRMVGSKLGKVAACDGEALDVEITLEAGPSVLYDAVVIPDGDRAAQALSMDAHALDFVRQQYRHCKPIMAVGAGAALLARADVPATLPGGGPDPAIVAADSSALTKAIAAFKKVLAAHRSFERETDPPEV
jgi:catalase